MALTRDRKRINVKGGGKLWIRQIFPDSGADTFFDLGYINETDFDDEHNMVESIDETGQYIDTKSGGQKVTWKVTLKQTGIDEINLLKNSDGKYYELYYSVLVANGNYQEVSIPLAKVLLGPKLKFAGGTERNLPVTFNALSPKADYTYSGGFNVTANVPYTIVENSAIQMTLSSGVPTNDLSDELAAAVL